MAEQTQVVTVKRKLPQVTLDERASATVRALRKDQDMTVEEALNFIVNDWVKMKLEALREASFDCAAQTAGRSAQTLSTTQDAPAGFDSRQEGVKCVGA